MNSFLSVTNRKTSTELHVNINRIKSYQTTDRLDKENNTHYLLIYILDNNIILEEEFTSDTERQTKLSTLDGLISN